MKKLDVTPITDSAQFKLKKGTLQFLQDANAEVFAALILGLIGSTYDPAKVYVLYGCVNSGAGNNYIISAGAVFYNGEVFLVDAVSFSAAGTAIFSIVTTHYGVNADPCTLSDTSVVNVHNIRKMAVGNGVSGAMNYSAKVVLRLVVPEPVNLTGEGVSGSYPNYVIAGANGLNKVLRAGSINVGNVDAGGNLYTATFPDVGTGNYYVMGTMVATSLGSPGLDATTIWVLRERTSSSFSIFVAERGNYTQSLIFEYIMFAK